MLFLVLAIVDVPFPDSFIAIPTIADALTPYLLWAFIKYSPVFLNTLSVGVFLAK